MEKEQKENIQNENLVAGENNKSTQPQDQTDKENDKKKNEDKKDLTPE